jgi:replication-associated recombination protein RarA
MQKLYEEKGEKRDTPAMHMIFSGNPGTGKTTVARIIARIYKKLGVLKRGHLVEVDRSKLVAGYVGQTAIQTNAIIDAALDGVLFIDEAYSLSSGGRSDYGGEAIATLLKRMEDQRDRMVVIVAGYEGEMEQFINSNPGLKSRFTKYIHFPDYTSKDLTAIFVALAKNQGYGLGTKEMLAIEEYMNQAVIEAKSGNARIARNLLSVVKERMALRVMADGSANKSELSRIMVEDIR